MVRGEQPGTADAGPTGRLVWRLVRVVPPGELDVWKAWLRLTVNDLQRALAWPASRRREAWARWLFAIPYSIPVTGRRPRDVATRSAGRDGGEAQASRGRRGGPRSRLAGARAPAARRRR